MEAADSVYQATGRKKKAPGTKIAEGIADLLFSLIIYVVFMIQASLVKSLPLEGVNSALYFLHLSLLHAWTAFEYKWYPMGYDIQALVSNFIYVALYPVSTILILFFYSSFFKYKNLGSIFYTELFQS